jgi:GT2 family glycosyltransferase
MIERNGSLSLRIYQVPVPKLFRPDKAPFRYPSYARDWGVEQDFSKFLQSSQFLTNDLHEATHLFLPIYWTRYWVQNNYAKDVACPSTIHYFNRDISDLSHDWTFEDRDITFLDHLRSPYVPSASGNYLFSRAAFEKAGGFPEFAGGLDTWGFGLRMVATGSRMRICPSTSYFHRFGHESYYVRESRHVARQSLIATSLVLEFPDLSSPRTVRKLLSRRHRFSWFSKIQKNPFRIRNQASGRVISY